MKKKQRDEIALKVENGRTKFLEIMGFLRQNQEITREVKHNWFAKVIQGDSAKWRLRALFIDTINAASGNNLGLTGESCKKFFEMMSELDEHPQITMQTFYGLFGENIRDHEHLFEIISNDKKRFANFGKKKTALFLRHLHVIHTSHDTRGRFISDYTIDPQQLKIPVDRVIVTVLNKIWGTDFEAYPHFVEINDIAYEELKDDFMLVEDLWFWGYFNTKVVGSKNMVSSSVNAEKYYSADFIFPNATLKGKLDAFSERINQL